MECASCGGTGWVVRVEDGAVWRRGTSIGVTVTRGAVRPFPVADDAKPAPDDRHTPCAKCRGTGEVR